MSGYTPVFSSIYDGSLYGRWPEAAVLATLLPLADARGHIDMSYEAIAGKTGWPMDLLRQGIAQLSEPDARSRSKNEEGRRLIPLDSEREWGWKVVNHGLYREKARKSSFDAARVADGRNAERMRSRRRPDATRDHPPSDSDSNSNLLKKATDVAGKREEAKTLWPRVLAAITHEDLRKSLPPEAHAAVRKIGDWYALGMKPRDLRGQTEQQFLNAYADLS